MHNFSQRQEKALVSACKRLEATQKRNKRDFDKTIHVVNSPIRPGDYVFLDPEDGGKTKKNLRGHAVGFYRILENAYLPLSSREGTRWNASTVTGSPALYLISTPHEWILYQPVPSVMTSKTTYGKAWLFENILGHRVSPKGPLQFHIQCNGLYEPTREPRSDVTEDTIAKYFFALRRMAIRENN